VNKNGTITQHPCAGTYKDMAAGFNREQCEEQFRLHLRFETFKSLKSAINGKNNINHQQIMGLLMLGYQLPGKMASIATRLNNAANNQQIMDAFKHNLPENPLWREGTLKRRWWCGAYATGLITVEDLLTLKKDAFSKISLTKVATGIKKNTKGEVLSIEHFKFDSTTVQYALNTARTKGNNPIVRDVLNQTAGGRAVIKAVESGTQIDFIIAKSNFDQTDYAKAVTSFRSGDYESAAAGFKKLLETNPNDALLWNDLAASYNNLGKYDLALECTGKIFKEIRDRSQYAAAYYNAGVARENLGQYESALENYKHAKKNGNKSLDVDTAIARVQKIMAKSAKMRAYNSGTQKVGATMQHRKLQNIRPLPKTGARRA
jgi:tetratricopeptide (TPR) repeat protein